MLIVTSNKAKKLLLLIYVGHIRLEELLRSRDDLKSHVEGLSPGYLTLSDFSHMTAMDPDCLAEIGRTMDMLDESGVGMVARVVPNPQQDVGFNILSHFHYKPNTPVIMCATFAEAVKTLSL